jgi:hypothetical protein
LRNYFFIKFFFNNKIIKFKLIMKSKNCKIDFSINESKLNDLDYMNSLVTVNNESKISIDLLDEVTCVPLKKEDILKNRSIIKPNRGYKIFLYI